ncbi:carbohydrate-binding module family 1 protein [Xylariaceae sp. AK1471]|nr:carbohydrate-binding module family 1 protein [Xylariaceae sp. AK1471]
MHFTKVSAGLSLMAGAVTAMPTTLKTRATGYQNVVYWGQNGGGTIENNDLSAYCTADAGIDIIVLAFLYQFGGGNTIPSGTVGQSCFISNTGQGQNCEALASAITKCQANGVTIILSLGGASGAYSLSSSSEAKAIGSYLWEAYGNSGSTSAQRPFGSAFVNGFDFDLELNRGNQYYADMISTLRTSFNSDPSNTYYITGAPQCPIPEPNMGVVIDNSKFDYLWPQFYNNNNYTFDPQILMPRIWKHSCRVIENSRRRNFMTEHRTALESLRYPCALPINGNAPFNYDQWLSYTAGTPSANAKIFIGVPAAPLGANGSPSGETYYATPNQLASIVADVKSEARFGGIMMWSAGFSDANVIGSCNYAQQARAILDTGSPCGGGPPSTTTRPPVGTSTKTPTGTSTSSSPGSTATGTVPQWGQCGGIGYTGPTKCQPPYSCVATGAYWSQCQ